MIVQATCHGADNRALVDALRASERPRARRRDGRRATSPTSELRALHAAGVRGVRFNFVKRLVDATPREVLIEIAERIAPLGWHIVIYFEAQDLPELYDFFTSLPTTVVVDHMGRPDVTQAASTAPEFELFVKLMREHPNFWSKVSCPERLSQQRPAALRRRRPVRAPHRRDVPGPRAVGHRLAAPEHEDAHARRRPAGRLHSAHRADAGAAAQKLLVDNPMRLYWSQ